MSIFKDTFVESIQSQLKVRQNAISKREPKDIHYLSARNSWARLSSSVNYKGSNDLAKKYVLQGGIFDENGKLRDGVGDSTKSYSNFSPNNNIYSKGIRPMPGITSVAVQSKGAYGSLREVTVNFVAWDIQQLEDLEVLYMRPGYSVLLEWGWSPYLNNSGSLESNIVPYDILNIDNINNLSKPKEQIYAELFAKATDGNYFDKKTRTKRKLTSHYGNYDAAFGFVKNYNWTARPDGGYDCMVVIITIGEVIESLKVNFSSFQTTTLTSNGIMASSIPGISISKMPKLEEAYSKNILAGVFYELYHIGYQKIPGSAKEGALVSGVIDKEGTEYDLFRQTININKGEESQEVGESDEQTYISLSSLVDIFNKYIILQDTSGKTPLVSLSVTEREYDKNELVTLNQESGAGYLLCLSHPLQISVDPTICLIRSPFWMDDRFSPPAVEFAEKEGQNIVKFTNDNFRSKAKGGNDLIDNLMKLAAQNNGLFSDKNEEEAIRLFNPVKNNELKIRELHLQLQQEQTKFGDLRDLMSRGLGLSVNEISIITGDPTGRLGAGDAKTSYQADLDSKKQRINKNKKEAAENLKFLSKLKYPYFPDDQFTQGVGIIGNIYINLQFLYKLSLSEELAGQDKREKNEINLYDFFKNVLSKVSPAIGNINNFDLHVDPIDGVGRIIDINYVTTQSQKQIYENAFELQMHNLQSTVRKYNLSSQIFSEQSSVVAIGAQVGNGALGTNANTLVEFNRGLIDRIIPKRQDPNDEFVGDYSMQLQARKNALDKHLSVLYTLFGQLEYGFVTDPDFDISKVNEYKGSLSDIINFYTSISKSSNKNRAIIPTKLSIEMDGIGGIVIGNVFRVPNDLLPRGYKEGESGNKLGYIVTGIAHKIVGGDWITTLDCQTIILDDPKSGIDIDFSNITLSSVRSPSIKADYTTGEFSYTGSPTTPPPALLKAMREYGITNQVEKAHFLAQCSHESMGFRVTTEYASGDAYEGRKSLGNTKPGDGVKFKGRGYIQVTGRSNYMAYQKYLRSKGMNVDLENNPGLLATTLAADSACYWWTRIGMPGSIARTGPSPDVVAKVTKRVNGGYNGLADRQNKFNQFWTKIKQNPNAYT